MNSLINLMAAIGVHRTLIIACGKYTEHNYFERSDDVSLFFLPNNMLHRYDVREKARLQGAIDSCRCTQVVFLGILDDEMKGLLSYSSSLHSLRAGLHFKTALLPGSGVIEAHLQSRALLEQYVMTQCNHLMEFHFIRDKIRRGQLCLRGIVGTLDTEDFKMVFTNGVRFNDLISMN